jgi:fatty acid desaturase
VTLPRGFKWLDPWHQFFGAHVAHHLFPGLSPRYARMVEDKVEELWPDRYHCMTITTALRKLWQTPWIYEDHTTLLDPVRDERHKTLGHGMPKD